MTKKIIIAIIIAVLMINCTNSNFEEKIVIDPDSFLKTNLKMSDFAEAVTYLPLSSEFLFGGIVDVKVKDSLIFICTSPDGLLRVFDFKGRFIHQIGSKGRGAGEYRSAVIFTVNDHQVFVLNHEKILVYSYNGHFLYDFSISEYQCNCDAMEYLNDSLYLFENIKMGYAKYNWLIIDTLGNELERKLNYMPRFKSQTMPLDHNVFTNRYGIGYWNLFNDTIFDVQTNNGAYKFFFVSNNQRLTPENIDNELFYYRSSFHPYRILESDKYLFMQYFLNEKKGIALYDKSSRQFKCDESRNDDSSFAGFTNDLDGGLPFVPVYYYIRDNAEFMLGWSYAYEYKKVSISNELENFSVKFPEKKKELEALANRLTDNDNPVLMLVKLKE